MTPSHPTRVPHHRRRRLFRKPPWVNAVPATVVQPARPVNPVAMVAMVSTACPASPEIAVHQPHQPQNWCPECQTNAHAKPHQAMLEHQDPRDPMDHPEMLADQALMASPETKGHADHPAHQAQQVPQETKAQLETPAELLVLAPAQLAHQARPASPVHQVPLANPARLVTMATQVPQAPPEMLVLQAVPARLVAPAPQVTPARPAHLAAANTAHLLVWLQVIKHLRSVWLVKTLHQRSREAPYYYPNTNQLGVAGHLHFFF